MADLRELGGAAQIPLYMKLYSLADSPDRVMAELYIDNAGLQKEGKPLQADPKLGMYVLDDAFVNPLLRMGTTWNMRYHEKAGVTDGTVAFTANLAKAPDDLVSTEDRSVTPNIFFNPWTVTPSSYLGKTGRKLPEVFLNDQDVLNKLEIRAADCKETRIGSAEGDLLTEVRQKKAPYRPLYYHDGGTLMDIMFDCYNRNMDIEAMDEAEIGRQECRILIDYLNYDYRFGGVAYAMDRIAAMQRADWLFDPEAKHSVLPYELMEAPKMGIDELRDSLEAVAGLDVEAGLRKPYEEGKTVNGLAAIYLQDKGLRQVAGDYGLSSDYMDVYLRSELLEPYSFSINGLAGTLNAFADPRVDSLIAGVYRGTQLRGEPMSAKYVYERGMMQEEMLCVKLNDLDQCVTPVEKLDVMATDLTYLAVASRIGAVCPDKDAQEKGWKLNDGQVSFEQVVGGAEGYAVRLHDMMYDFMNSGNSGYVLGKETSKTPSVNEITSGFLENPEEWLGIVNRFRDVTIQATCVPMVGMERLPQLEAVHWKEFMEQVDKNQDLLDKFAAIAEMDVDRNREDQYEG